MNRNKSKSSSRVIKYLLLPVIVGIAVLFAGKLINRWPLENSPPNAVISPTETTIKANTNIMFSAAASSDSNDENYRLAYRWTVGGFDPKESYIANCDPYLDDQSLFNCRFLVPGTHNVSITVTDSDGAESTASASVTVEMENGYIGLALHFGQQDKDPNAIKAIMYAVDWPSVQALLRGRLLILFDPDIEQPVYASIIKRSVEMAKQYAQQADGIEELWWSIPNVDKAVYTKIRDDIEDAEIGISLHFIEESKLIPQVSTRPYSTPGNSGPGVGPAEGGEPENGTGGISDNFRFIVLSDPDELIQHYNGSLKTE